MDVKQLIDVNDFPFGKKKDKTKYLHQRPTIKPNLGKKKHNLLPKTHVPKVLLYENTMQRKTLTIKTLFYGRQQRDVRRGYEKTRHAFVDRIRTKQRLHDHWDVRYTVMKDAYVAEYGTKYMPTEEDPEEYTVFKYAKFAAPINVVCYFLQSGNDPRKKDLAKRQKLEKKLASMTKDPLYEYLKRRGHPVNKFPQDKNQTKICSKDQRFKALSESLTNPGFETDGYLQLSPGYAKGIIPPLKRRPPGKPRDIELPGFYERFKVKRESSACSQESGVKRSISMFSIYDDEHSSVSSLA